MKTVSKHAIVPYSASQMYHLVNDVASYPEFVPDCTGIVIHANAGNVMDVSMMVEKMGIKMTMRTRNTLFPNEKVAMDLESGPLKHLHGQWLFTPLNEQAAKIEFHLQFELTSGLLKRVLASYFKGLAETMITAFEKRAREIYGKPSI